MNDLTPYERLCADNADLRARLELAEERAYSDGAEIARLRADRAELLFVLEDMEFLARQAGKTPGPLQDSFNRSAQDARDVIAKAEAKR